MRYDLECRFDTRNSFYGKAKIEILNNSIEFIKDLYSYGTNVARYRVDKIDNCKEYYEYFGKYSQTTTRHQKEFFKQLGLNDKEIKKLFENGILIFENGKESE